jgi:D-alanyl-D-alanine endopeptidase (penicillin-binding protein 7)
MKRVHTLCVMLSVALGLSVGGVPSKAHAASDSAAVSAKKKKPAGKPASPQPAAKPKPKAAPDRLSNSGRVMPVVARRPDRALIAGTAVAAGAAVGVMSRGQAEGLHRTPDPLDLKSAVAHVEDLDTREVLFSKNSEAVLPIASITKLMTALVVADAGLNLDETLTITEADVDTEKHSSSRLRVGYTMSRRDALHLALMSSENRAAHALGRHYPGGLQAFVAAMNAKAHSLGMNDSRFVEPTGLSSSNVSSGPDLARLLRVTNDKPLIRELSTSPGQVFTFNGRPLQFNNTNALVKSNQWDINVSKTGFISEAGRGLVMHVKIEGRRLAIVLLDSFGKASRLGDANRIRKWLETHHAEVAPVKVQAPALQQRERRT